MKLVVTGASENCRITSRSARKQSRSMSSLNRAKSSFWVGFTTVGAAAGSPTSSQAR